MLGVGGHLLSGVIVADGGELGHGVFGEVGAVGDLPLVVGLEEDGADQAQDGGVVGEDPDDVGAPLDL